MSLRQDTRGAASLPAGRLCSGLEQLTDRQLAGLLSDPARRDAACETLVDRYQSLVQSCARRYHLPAQYTEELIQVGYVGLLKAINNFDPAVADELGPYAQTSVSGEIKRFFRDKRWQLRVSRPEQELRLRARAARSELIQQLGHMPDDGEVAAHLQVSTELLAAADKAARALTPMSLDAKVSDPDGLTLGDLMGAEDPDLERTIDMEAVQAHWGDLPRRQQQILTMRFYGNMTQAQIADRVGCSQMHVSRLEGRALSYLREQLLTD